MARRSATANGCCACNQAVSATRPRRTRRKALSGIQKPIPHCIWIPGPRASLTSRHDGGQVSSRVNGKFYRENRFRFAKRFANSERSETLSGTFVVSCLTSCTKFGASALTKNFRARFDSDSRPIPSLRTKEDDSQNIRAFLLNFARAIEASALTQNFSRAIFFRLAKRFVLCERSGTFPRTKPPPSGGGFSCAV